MFDVIYEKIWFVIAFSPVSKSACNLMCKNYNVGGESINKSFNKEPPCFEA